MFEFDLKGFFDNVEVSNISELLVKKLGYPPEVANFFLDLNKSIPKLKDVDLMDESATRGKMALKKALEKGEMTPELSEHPCVSEDEPSDRELEELLISHGLPADSIALGRIEREIVIAKFREEE